MRTLFLVIIALIVYGSLYPFNFTAWDTDGASFTKLVDFTPSRTGISDLVQNILLFVPFGLFGMQLMPGLKRWQRTAVVLLLGFNVAFGVQVAQLWLPGRVAAGTDTFWNMIGCIAGCVIGVVPFSQKLARVTHQDWRFSIPLMLALAWMAYQWAPFIPSLDIGLLKTQLKSLLLNPRVSVLWTFQGIVTWLVIFHFLDSSNLQRVQRRHYPLIAAFVVVAGLFIVGNTFKADRVVGALLAIPVWWLLPQRGRSSLLAALMMILITGIKFESLEIRETSGSMSWVPFSGALGGNMMINVLATFKKLILYGSLTWLLVQSNVRLGIATVITASLVFITEYGQIFFVGTSPEVTDALLAIGIGIAFHIYGNTSPNTTPDGSQKQGLYKKPIPLPPTSKPAIVVGIMALMAIGVTALLMLERDPVVTAPPWSSFPASVILDPHTHTRYSDGSLTPRALTELAVENGCTALAMTDHSDGKGASEKQLQEIRSLRALFPSLLLFSGVEMNIPRYKGREHLNLIVTPDIESVYLRSIADIAEDSIDSSSANGGDTDKTFARTIAAIPDFSTKVFTLYNHPSRKVEQLKESATDILRWRGFGLSVNAISGAPGHQKSGSIGSYRTKHLPIDRWDPMIAEVGGGWDQLLARGHDIWGAIAVSDYHNSKMDEAPCGFARTHVSVPQRGYEGVITGLREGTFWADHGLLLESLVLSVQIDTQSKAVFPGSKVSMNSADPLAVYSVELERGRGGANRPLQVEVISNCRTGEIEQLAEFELRESEGQATGVVPIYETGEDGQSCYLRARVRLVKPDVPDLLAYTNPIRFYL